MEIMFEKCLRELLAKRRKTQSELAEYLCISTQAVSKWCRGENMPDIALLPRIASFLDVSVDDLLGVGESRKQEKIQEYRVKSVRLGSDVVKNIELWRQAYLEFPNDMHVIEGLMVALSRPGDEKYDNETISLAERIVKESADERQRGLARQILCCIYDRSANPEKAREYAEGAGCIHQSREVLLSNILTGEEGTRCSLQLLLACLDLIGSAEYKLCQNSSDEKNLPLHEFYLNLLALYFNDGFYGIFARDAADRHKLLARAYLSCRKDEQKAFEHLNAALKFARQYDNLSVPCTYTSTLLKGYTDHQMRLLNVTGTLSESLLRFMNGSEFDSVRGKDWFTSIEQELKNS